MKTGKITKFAASILICEGAGVIGSLFTAPAISNWYSLLRKPEISLPNWLFGPAWLFLFFLMGVSLYLVWEKRPISKIRKDALAVFSLQLILNVLWSVLFFGLKSPFLALIEIIFFWLAIVATIVYFYRVSKTAALLLLPYILWVSFAIILNFLIWQIN